MDAYKNKGVSGLVNVGNTCFMNAVLQCLSSSLPLTKYFLMKEFAGDVPYFIKSKDENNLQKFVGLYYKLIHAMWEENMTIQPSTFHTIMQICNKQFQGFQQQDSHECLVFILDMLHKALSMEVDVSISGDVQDSEDDRILTSYKKWQNFLQVFKYSVVTKLFYGQFESALKCCGCNNIGYNYDPFSYLSVPISDSCETIYDCMDIYFEPETLSEDNQYNCSKCGTKQDAIKKIGLWMLPEIIIVQLKRFDYNGRKVQKKIQFPLHNLNLSKYKVRFKNENELELYDLYAVISHSGSLNGGHYVAKTLHQTGKWHLFDDKSVRPIKDASELVNENAYVLFYRKK